MEISQHVPYTDMNKAAKKLAAAHAGVREQIAQHAANEAKRREQAHAALSAENKLKEVSA